MAQHHEFETWDQTDRRLQQAEGLPFSELLESEQVARALTALGVEVRRRGYEPIVTLWAFLSQVLSADHSCRDAVGRVLAWRVAQGKSPCSTDTTSDCEARRRLPVELARATGARHRSRVGSAGPRGLAVERTTGQDRRWDDGHHARHSGQPSR